MPNEYVPDRWVMLKISSKDTSVVYKILAGWSGSFTYGQSYKLNSGCTRVRREGHYFIFDGYSGSTYRCHSDAYGFTSYMAEILEQIRQRIKEVDGITEVMDENIDFLKLPVTPQV